MINKKKEFKMVSVENLINSNDIIDMIHAVNGRRWSLSYFNIKKNFKGFPDPAYQSGRIYLWSKEDINEYISNNIHTN